MAKTTKQLNDTQVRLAKPKEKEYNLSDGKGLALRVRPSGSKIWLFNYPKPFTKKRTNISFGTYPDVTLAIARDFASEARELLALNVDPKVHSQQSDADKKKALENTFGRMAEKWKELKSTKVKSNTMDNAWQKVNKHILPTFKNIPLKDIKPQMVVDCFEKLKDEGKLETVKRSCQHMNEIMRLALANGLIDFNPLSDITKLFPSPKSKHMPTIKPEELPELMTALKNAKLTPTIRLLFLWQLHTVTRASEAAEARWDEINLDKETWVIPAERMKMGREHAIPLTSQTISILAELKPISETRDYLFPGFKDPSSHADPESVNKALRRMGYRNRLVSHGFRSIASTAFNEREFNPDVIEAVLSHQHDNEIRRAYNHAQYIEKRKHLMSWWSEFIERAEQGKTDTIESKHLRLVTNQ